MKDNVALEFHRRISNRRADPKTPLPLGVFYHIACMGHWREVVEEQFRLIKHVGLTAVTSCILGAVEDVEECKHLAETAGIRLRIEYASENLKECEEPALRELQRWAKNIPDGSVLYLHTKGVSRPDDPVKTQWRRVMQRFVVADFEKNLERLSEFDAVGVDWQDSPQYPHFSGNFWMARCDWINKLPDVAAYRKRPNGSIAGHSWSRMFAEMWIGSQPWHHIKSLCCRNRCLWQGQEPYTYPTEIPGFIYERQLCFGGAG